MQMDEGHIMFIDVMLKIANCGINVHAAKVPLQEIIPRLFKQTFNDWSKLRMKHGKQPLPVEEQNPIGLTQPKFVRKRSDRAEALAEALPDRGSSNNVLKI